MKEEEPGKGKVIKFTGRPKQSGDKGTRKEPNSEVGGVPEIINVTDEKVREAIKKIEDLITTRQLVRYYLRQHGYTTMPDIPEAVVTAGRKRWEGMSAEQLLYVAQNFTEEDLEESPVAYLELIRLLRKALEE